MKLQTLFVLSFGFHICLWIFIAILFFVLGAICWPYTINSWLEYAGKDAVVVWWQGGLLGLVPAIGQCALPAAVATWIILM